MCVCMCARAGVCVCVCVQKPPNGLAVTRILLEVVQEVVDGGSESWDGRNLTRGQKSMHRFTYLCRRLLK